LLFLRCILHLFLNGSEWGFDFRPQFRELHKIRQHAILQDIPLLALTATAVPRVQDDIVSSLGMRNPVQAIQSFDRPNLKIFVHRKPASGGFATALKPLVDTLNNIGGVNGGGPVRTSAPQQSTIVYCPTRNDVDQLATYFQQSISNPNIRCVAYHAGMSAQQRTEAHTAFLTGQATLVCATVAFGMGIDKEDVRRVVHYGAPKTIEEYYQQIGRAGRDGAMAECILYTSTADFDRYQSDFYLGKLSGAAKQVTLASMAALRKYSLDTQNCRRRMLVQHFGQVPSFGTHCGTCDVCVALKRYGDDVNRDLAHLGARIVLTVVGALNQQGSSTIVKVIGGNTVENYRYEYRHSPTQVQQQVQTMNRDMLPKKFPAAYYKELMTIMTQSGYLTESQKSSNQGGFQRTWTVYSLSSQGQSALNNTSIPIRIPVPAYLREQERKEEERRQKVLADLEKSSFKDKLPQEEVQAGDGVAIRAYSKWLNYVQKAEEMGRNDRVHDLNQLQVLLEDWRSQVAVEYSMAPVNVLAEHIMISLAYTLATLQPGAKLTAEEITAAGVRSRAIPRLVTLLDAWVNKAQPAPTTATTASAQGGLSNPTQNSSDDAKMIFLGRVKASKPWAHAVYKPVKKTRIAVWESSYIRFTKGESPTTIAMSPEGGRRQPIQAATVVGHLLEAVVQGREMDLQRLAQCLPPPTQSEWQRLENAELTMAMSVTGDPADSGVSGESFKMTDLIRPIIGETLADTPFTERTEADKQLFSYWCDKLKWYMALKRINHVPTFSSGSTLLQAPTVVI
jgi:RecQ family ATP-dependent DNA helicase